ncbi:MAG: O-antigen ligase family protein [Dechloromonas sp.]|nr:O-antigen ligase family protein [Dechloromonas sp.]
MKAFAAAILPRTDRLISDWIGPASVFLVCTGLLWLPERGLFPKLAYPAVLSAIILVACHPKAMLDWIRQPVGMVLALFAGYFALTLGWTDSDEAPQALIMRQTQVVLWCALVFLLARANFERLRGALMLAAGLASLAAVYEVTRFLLVGASARLASEGALSNPLLISHIYGFFGALWLGWLLTDSAGGSRLTRITALVPILLLLVFTGSRTPLLATLATGLWLAAAIGGRRAALLLVGLIVGCGAIVVLFQDLVLARGLSYRPEIWANALNQGLQKPWFGHGLGAPLTIQLPDFSYAFRDPHNMTLSVFYRGGFAGVGLWVALYTVALVGALRHRRDRFVVVASAAVVYGLVAGMTEGGALFPRPKEHWFLIWIPLAFLIAAIDRSTRLVRLP